MQIVATRNRGPFVSNHGGENSWVIELCCRFGIGLPDGFHHRPGGLRVCNRLGHGAVSLPDDNVRHGISRCLATLMHGLIPAYQYLIFHEGRIAVIDLVHNTQPFCMIRDHQKIQWP